MMFAQWQNLLMTHFSECIPIDEQCMTIHWSAGSSFPCFPPFLSLDNQFNTALFLSCLFSPTHFWSLYCLLAPPLLNCNTSHFTHRLVLSSPGSFNISINFSETAGCITSWKIESSRFMPSEKCYIQSTCPVIQIMFFIFCKLPLKNFYFCRTRQTER